MSKRSKEKCEAYQSLTREGLDFESFNHVSPNQGSESFPHLVAKAAVLHVGINNGYWVGSEVKTQNGDEIDVLLWGHPDRLTYACEVESSPTGEVKEKKVNQYVHNQPGVDDMILINVTEMPMDMLEALEYVSEELGLEP